MNQQRITSSLVAACALLLGCAPLTLLYRGLFEWALPTTVLVAAIVGASIGVRVLRGNPLYQVAAMFGVFLLLTTWMFRSGEEYLGIVPSTGTLGHFGTLLAQAGQTIGKQTIPVDSTPGLVFLTAIAIAALAILGEVFVSMIRVPSLVGLTLLVLYLVPVSILKSSVPWMLFAPGALGYLWLLMTDNIERVRRYGRRFSGDGRGIDRWEPSPLATTGRWMTALLIPLALLVPAALPSMDAGLINVIGNGLGGNGNGGGGDGGSVNPWATLYGSLNRPETKVLGYLRTKHPNYMKMYTADQLDNNGFTASTSLSDSAEPVTTGIGDANPVTDHQKLVPASFQVTGLNDRALPLMPNPQVFDNVNERWLYDPPKGTVTSSSETTRDLKEFSYTFDAYLPTARQLRDAAPEPKNSEIFKNNTDTPPSKKVANLVDRIRGDTDDPNEYDMVRAIRSYFSQDNGFEYDLSTKYQKTPHPIESFLFKGKKGFCQQYAAAMAWMVRAAGIPARVAIGLTSGSEYKKNTWRVTNQNFHAWVEVYFDGYGWIPFDPTPASGVSGSIDFAYAPDPDSDGNGHGGNGNKPDPQGNGGGGSNNGKNPHDRDPNNPDGISQVAYSGVRPAPVWPYWMLAGAVVALLAAAPAASRWRRRRAMLRARVGDATVEARFAWQELCDSLRDLRMPVGPSDTARSVARRLIAEEGLDDAAAAGLRHLAAAQERASYAPRPPGELNLRQASRAARYGVAATCKPMTRLRADLLPPTVLSRWRDSGSALVTGVGTAIGRARSLVARSLSRPFRK